MKMKKILNLNDALINFNKVNFNYQSNEKNISFKKY